mmetsp:Transcript_48355/g.136672  ORF Transcript_48355/g.136672 Transcript_48355/m.136672 type:complete len:214 (-) Transcript_48355:136-777(-)
MRRTMRSSPRDWISASRAARNRSHMGSTTRSKSWHWQNSPEKYLFVPTISFTAAASMPSGIASTITGFLPPSSRVTGVSVCAALAITRRPMAVPPVNMMWSKPKSMRRSHTDAPPWTTVTASGGSAPRTSSARRALVRGVASGGFMTQQFPAASAPRHGSTLSRAGAFHGAMFRMTPFGSLTQSQSQSMPPRRSAGIVSASTLVSHHSPTLDT